MTAINSVVAGPDGFLISVQAHPGGQHTLWFSEDGRDWRPTDLPAGSMPLSMANDGSGWMALSHSHVAGEPSIVYESADGVSWTEVDDVQEAPEDFVPSEFDRFLGGPRLVGRDGTWVIAQELYRARLVRSPGHPPMTAEPGTDGHSQKSEDARIHDLVVIEDMIVAIGYENKIGAPTKLYYSEDAETWQSVLPIHDLHDLDWLGGNLIALGDGGGDVFAWNSSAEQAPPD